MNEVDIRFECIRLALEFMSLYPLCGQSVTELAEDVYKFVTAPRADAAD